jgi:putative tricarboxylic transport membrane protein
VFQNHDRIAGILIFATGAFLFNDTLDFPEESAHFPRMILGLWMVLSGWMVLRSFVVADWRNMEYEAFFIHTGRFILAVTMMALYIFAIDEIGYYTTTLIYIPVMAWLLGYRSKTVIIASTTIYLGIVLVVFDILFERELPEEFFMQ